MCRTRLMFACVYSSTRGKALNKVFGSVCTTSLIDLQNQYCLTILVVLLPLVQRFAMTCHVARCYTYTFARHFKPSSSNDSVSFTLLFSPYLEDYQSILPSTQSSGWYYRQVVGVVLRRIGKRSGRTCSHLVWNVLDFKNGYTIHHPRMKKTRAI